MRFPSRLSHMGPWHLGQDGASVAPGEETDSRSDIVGETAVTAVAACRGGGVEGREV